MSLPLEDIKVFAYHGLYESEIKKGQNFYISIEYKQDYLQLVWFWGVYLLVMLSSMVF